MVAAELAHAVRGAAQQLPAAFLVGIVAAYALHLVGKDLAEQMKRVSDSLDRVAEKLAASR